MKEARQEEAITSEGAWRLAYDKRGKLEVIEVGLKETRKLTSRGTALKRLTGPLLSGSRFRAAVGRPGSWRQQGKAARDTRAVFSVAIVTAP